GDLRGRWRANRCPEAPGSRGTPLVRYRPPSPSLMLDGRGSRRDAVPLLDLFALVDLDHLGDGLIGIGAQDSNSAEGLDFPQRLRGSVAPVDGQFVAPSEPIVETEIDLDPPALVIDLPHHPLHTGRRWVHRCRARIRGIPAAGVLAPILLQGTDETIDL